MPTDEVLCTAHRFSSLSPSLRALIPPEQRHHRGRRRRSRSCSRFDVDSRSSRGRTPYVWHVS